MNAFCWDSFRSVPVVGILRGFGIDVIRPMVEAMQRGGLTTIEITMNTPSAPEQIRAACETAGGKLNVGAGTVTDLERLLVALQAGASFVVTPNVNREIITECLRRRVPVFPGALSPTEVASAMDLGATWVKVFPADRGGPAHLRRLKELFPAIRMLPTGGVDLDSLRAFRKAGADGYGVGSPLFDRDRIEAGDWDWLAARCRAFAQLAAPV